MKDISANMNTFTKVMADVAVDNQQQINSMVKQLSEMSDAHERNGRQYAEYYRRS